MAGNILIVDDEPAIDYLMLQMFRKEIRNNEYQLHFAKDGEEALGKLEDSLEIEVVLTDINMPGMDGLRLLDQIRRRFPKVKVIMVSAYFDHRRMSVAQGLGAFGFINKPVKVAEMRALLDQALGPRTD